MDEVNWRITIQFLEEEYISTGALVEVINEVITINPAQLQKEEVTISGKKVISQCKCLLTQRNETAIWPHVYQMDAPKFCTHYDHQPPKAISSFVIFVSFHLCHVFSTSSFHSSTFYVLFFFLTHWTSKPISKINHVQEVICL